MTAFRSAGNGEPIPPTVDPTIFYKAVLEGCAADSIFRSEAALWRKRHPGKDGLDFLWHVLKPARDGSNPLRFPNVASAVAFVLTQLPRTDNWKDET